MKRKIGTRHGWVLNPGRQGHMRRLKNNSQTCLRLESIPGSQDHMQRLRKIIHKPYQAGIELATHWLQGASKRSTSFNEVAATCAVKGHAGLVKTLWTNGSAKQAQTWKVTGSNPSLKTRRQREVFSAIFSGGFTVTFIIS